MFRCCCCCRSRSDDAAEQTLGVERFTLARRPQRQRQLTHHRRQPTQPASVAFLLAGIPLPDLRLAADVTQRREVEESPRQRLATLADVQLSLLHPAGT